MRRGTWTIGIAIGLLASAGADAAPKPADPAVPVIIQHATAAASDGSLAPERDLAPLIDKLATASPGDQLSLINAIGRLGDEEGAYPAAAKAYLYQRGVPALMALLNDAAPDVREDALFALCPLNVSGDTLAQALAKASGGPPAVQRAGEELKSCRAGRPGEGNPVGITPPAGAAAEQQALGFLRAHHAGASPLQLQSAAAEGKADVVAAELDAGVDPKFAAGGDGQGVLFAAAACVGDDEPVEARRATIELLVRRGADPALKDKNGNTAMMDAVQTCPRSVIETLLGAGVPAESLNNQDTTPLGFAFMLGKWDIAETLIKGGARLTQKQIDTIFFDLPADPAKRALIDRARSTL